MKSDGYFFDGQSAVKHAVSITVIGTEIVIQSKTGQVLAKWPLHEVDLLPDGRRDNHLQLTNAHFPDARLTVEDPSLIGRLSTRCCPKSLESVFVAAISGCTLP